MKIASLQTGQESFLGVRRGKGYANLNAVDPSLPRDLGALLRSDPDWKKLADLAERAPLVTEFAYRPLVTDPGKILCLGLNYVDHAAESSHQRPDYPVIFGRYPASFVGHEQPLIRPSLSTHFDYEAELAIVIGKTGKKIAKDRALDHVAGYSLLNDGSIRDYQMKSPQWTIGKNFDASGSFGPELLTPDELPPGACGLVLRGRLNGETMQEANTSDMIFGVEDAIAIVSEAMTLHAGDVIAMGTPGGVGFVRNPPVFMKPGDVFEVEVERIGVLRNRVDAE